MRPTGQQHLKTERSSPNKTNVALSTPVRFTPRAYEDEFRHLNRVDRSTEGIPGLVDRETGTIRPDPRSQFATTSTVGE